MDTKGFTDQVDNYIQNLRHVMYQPIVERDVGNAPVDRQKAFLLLLPLLNGEKWTEEMQTVALAIGAIHTAFDVHDRIDSKDASSKEQQLKVLAGDHFSGIHYKLLASIPNFHLIRSLSAAIARVNEAKTTLLQSPPADPEAVLRLIGEVECACIVEFCQTFGFERYIDILDTVFPLLWLQGRHDKFKDRQPDNRMYWLDKLQTDLDRKIRVSNFLHKSLAGELYRMTGQGESKLI